MKDEKRLYLLHKSDFKGCEEWLPVFIEHLLSRAKIGDSDAMYELGRYYHEEKREGLARYFLEEASLRGSLDAEKLLKNYPPFQPFQKMIQKQIRKKTA